MPRLAGGGAHHAGDEFVGHFGHRLQAAGHARAAPRADRHQQRRRARPRAACRGRNWSGRRRGPPTWIDTIGDEWQNCSIGLIAGPASVATSSSPRRRPLVAPAAPRPPRGVPFGPGGRAPHVFIRRVAPDKGELRSEVAPLGEVGPDHVPDPRRDADQEEHNRKGRIGVRAPVEAPADRPADEDRRDEFAARAQAPSDIAEPKTSRLAAVRARAWRAGARRGCAFQLARQPFEPRAQRGESSSSGPWGPDSWGQSLAWRARAGVARIGGRRVKSERQGRSGRLTLARPLGQGRPRLDPNGLRMPKSPPPPRARQGRRDHRPERRLRRVAERPAGKLPSASGHVRAPAASPAGSGPHGRGLIPLQLGVDIREATRLLIAWNVGGWAFLLSILRDDDADAKRTRASASRPGGREASGRPAGLGIVAASPPWRRSYGSLGPVKDMTGWPKAGHLALVGRRCSAPGPSSR